MKETYFCNKTKILPRTPSAYELEETNMSMGHVSDGEGRSGRERIYEDGRERVYDEDSGITWVDFTEIIRQASAGGRSATCR